MCPLCSGLTCYPLLFVGERTHVDPTETSVLSYPALPPEASSHNASVAVVNPHPQDQTLQNQTSPVDLGPEGTGGDQEPYGGCIRGNIFSSCTVYKIYVHPQSQFVARTK